MIVKDFSNQKYEDDDDKSFSVKTIDDERLIDSVPGLDDEEEFSKSMYNYGDNEDLPDSDREAECQGKGISRNSCFNQ